MDYCDTLGISMYPFGVICVPWFFWKHIMHRSFFYLPSFLRYQNIVHPYSNNSSTEIHDGYHHPTLVQIGLGPSHKTRETMDLSLHFENFGFEN
jgi:hypothetical protein